jgi:phosphoserine phosphatase
MELVITLIADENCNILSRTDITSVREHFKASSPSWLANEIACDLYFKGNLEVQRAKAKKLFAGKKIDAVVQPTQNRKKKLLLADMDSTILAGESLDDLAEFAGLKDKVGSITFRAMRGEIDFEEALRARVQMLQGLPEKFLEDTWSKSAFTPGARELIATMGKNGARCVLVSGGFRFFTQRVARTLGFHDDFANDLILKEGRLTGEVKEPILQKESKLLILRKMIDRMGIDKTESMTVGDGANDLPMILAAGLGIAYHAKPLVEAQAPVCIRHTNLASLLYLQGYTQSQFVI